ncbi:MAG: P-loop NTPase [Spirochaetaceae bacterium]|jgi:flagellar biosynthesis protein FlhG|nr:P-loop NTPase [Spirochaetaceae bacterium]
MRVIPIASGKGGVGKSLLAANLSVAFAQRGMRVVLADLDLGASNLHLIIGHRKPGGSLGSFLSDGKSVFANIVADTDIAGLRFIPGDAEIPGMATLKPAERRRIVRGFQSLKNNTDILVLDLGAGTHQPILEFFLTSSTGIVVSAPTVTAILNAYVFLKNAVFRLMYTSFSKGSPAFKHIEMLRKTENGLRMLYLPRMLTELETVDGPSVAAFRANMAKFRPRLVMNMLDDPKDSEVALKIRRSCESYLGLSLEHLGILYRDGIQDTALASRLPVVLYKPAAIISQGIYRIADKLIAAVEEEEDFTTEDIDASFEEAAYEAESDFENKMEYVEDLLHSGTLSQGDLLETVKTQQIEIAKLKKENNFLKLKLSRAITQGYRP